MRAIVADDSAQLTIVERPTPRPRSGEVLIRVAAAGLNRADILQRKGFYDPPAGTSDVLGLECSGIITELSDDVEGFAVGDQVVALLAGGGYAEYVTVPAGQVAPVPAGMDLATAAGLMETAATVWSNVFDVARLRRGETFLVHGGSSGIGTTAIRLAKHFGATVVTTVGSTAKADFCRQLGADLVVNYREQDFAEEIAAAGLAADVILDIIGAKYLEQNVASLAPRGRLVVIGLQGGVKGTLALGALLSKGATVTATSLRFRPAQEKAAIVMGLREHVWPLYSHGDIDVIVDRRFAFEDAQEAHAYMESSSHIGKIILEVNG